MIVNFIDALVLVGITPMIKANLVNGIKGILGQGFVFVYFTFASFKMLYLVYVNSYILGTMLPVEESDIISAYKKFASMNVNKVASLEITFTSSSPSKALVLSGEIVIMCSA